MITPPSSQPAPIKYSKFLPLPIICTLLATAAMVAGSTLARGDDVVAIYAFTHYFIIFAMIMNMILFFATVSTGAATESKGLGNLFVFWDLAILFGLVIAMIFGMSSWQKKPVAALNKVESQLAPVVEEFYSHGAIQAYSQDQPLNSPYVLIEAEMIVDGNGNPVFTKPEIDPDDPNAETSFMANNTYSQNIQYLKEYMQGGKPESYKTLAVVVHTWVYTGRQIRLDMGTAPELRQQVNVYIVDTTTWKVAAQVGPLIGGRAHLPSRGPGAGTIYIDELRGKEVSIKKILRLLDRLPWQ